MKKTLVTLIQAAITLALLWWIFRDGEKRALMWETLRTANWWWFLPGGTGGDLIKMYYASREAPGKKAAAVLSVFMDRVVGVFALIFLAGVISAISLSELWAAPELHPVLFSLLVILLGAVGVLVGGFLVEKFHLAGWLPLRLVPPEGIQDSGPGVVLSNSFGFGGSNASLIFRRVEK